MRDLHAARRSLAVADVADRSQDAGDVLWPDNLPLTPAVLEQADREAYERYEAARDRARGALEAWEVGRPLTVVLPNGIETVSSVYKVLVDPERQADKLFRSLPRLPRMGRPPEAVLGPKRIIRPSSQLRAVKERG